MEIVQTRKGDSIELKVKGRLDAYWSDHLSSELTAVVRQEIHHIELNLSEITYVSSAGIRVLLHVFQQLNSIGGTFRVTELSPAARNVLEMAGMMEMLSAPIAGVVAFPQAGLKSYRGLSYESYLMERAGSLRCRMLGNPELLDGCRYRESDARKISLSGNSLAVGLGAFGANFTECRDRFGEFLAVSGIAAYLPTDGTNVPDYLVSSGNYVPEMMILYTLLGEGSWKSLIRFESGKESPPAGLNDLLSLAFEVEDNDSIGFVMIGETAGLVGVALTKSPVSGSQEGAPFRYPEAVDWLTFTSERVHSRSMTMVAGIASRNTVASPMLRSVDKTGSIFGHFHAAAFPYRPLRKGLIPLRETITTLFELNRVDGILHLIDDDREIGGVGRSEFLRGACWISPVTEWVQES